MNKDSTVENLFVKVRVWEVTWGRGERRKGEVKFGRRRRRRGTRRARFWRTIVGCGERWCTSIEARVRM